MFETFQVADYPIFGDQCVRWRPHRPQPIRGRLSALIARVLSRWTEQVFSSEFTESWEVRSETALATEVCVRWESALTKGKPLDGATMEWGMADFPRNVTIGAPADD